MGTFTDISREFLQQTCIDAESFVRLDLGKVLALAVDYAALNGSGVGGQPLGILQNTDITQYPLGTNGGALTWAAVVGLEGAIAAADADFGDLAYCTNARVVSIAKQTPKIGEQFPVFIAEPLQALRPRSRWK